MSDPGAVAAAGPLVGVKVVEFAGLGAAPFAGMLLADLGADVVRIDRPVRRRPTRSNSSHAAAVPSRWISKNPPTSRPRSRCSRKRTR